MSVFENRKNLDCPSKIQDEGPCYVEIDTAFRPTRIREAGDEEKAESVEIETPLG
jgi:hypothetical protein